MSQTELMERDANLEWLAARVREVRRAQGLTQEQVSERSGLHVTYIAGIEGGKRNPSFVSLVALAKGLGIGLNELLSPL